MHDKKEIKNASWKDEVEYAGFFSRVFASLIDTAVIILPLSLLFAEIFVLAWGGANIGEAESNMILQSASDPVKQQEVILYMLENGYVTRWIAENIIFTLFSGALVLLAWYFFAATPGKIILGMKIVDAETGLPTTNRQNIIRYLGYFVAMFPMFIGMFWVGLDKRKQGWHDKMANSVVVYKRSLPAELTKLTQASEDNRKEG